MTARKLVRRWVRPTRDFLLGLGVYAAVGCSGLADAGAAAQLFGGAAHARLLEHPVALQPAQSADWAGIAIIGAPAGDRLAALAVSSSMTSVMMSTIMALAFASLFSLNLWFARHLRHAYRVQLRASRRQRR